MNVGIYIELGGIFTMKPPDSVIDLYAASAQVESQTRSENIKFGIQNRMRSGKTILNYIQFLSYTKGPNGVLQIVLEEAEIIRKIFDLYIQGNGVRKIKSIWNLTQPLIVVGLDCLSDSFFTSFIALSFLVIYDSTG